MLDILAKIVGPNRAVSIYVALQRFGIPIALVAAFAIALALIIEISSAARMEHLAYVRARVVNMTPLTTDKSKGVFVDLVLPDGQELKLTETEGSISKSIKDTACVEERRDTRTGKVSFRLRLPHRCAT